MDCIAAQAAMWKCGCPAAIFSSTTVAIPSSLFCQEAVDKILLKLRRETNELRTINGGDNSLSCEHIKIEPGTIITSIPQVKAAQESQSEHLVDDIDPNKISERSLCVFSVTSDEISGGVKLVRRSGDQGCFVA